jgi:hypothetical protein
MVVHSRKLSKISILSTVTGSLRFFFFFLLLQAEKYIRTEKYQGELLLFKLLIRDEKRGSVDHDRSEKETYDGATGTLL